MRAMWSGAITFGLIHIPVRIYSATKESHLSFDLLHKGDLSPIRYARMCKAEEKEVPYNEIVKGYEYQKGDYVVIEENLFKQIEQRDQTIEIIHFSKIEEIDSIYFEKPYFLEPVKIGEKAYALLRDVLAKSGKVAIVKFVFRNKEHIGVIKPYLNALIIDQLRFADEINDLDGLKIPEELQANKKEIEMALKLVDQQTEKFQPEIYHDEYREKLQEIIDAKIKGIPSRKKGTPSPKPSKVHDMMALLKASLEKDQLRKKSSKKHKKAM